MSINTKTFFKEFIKVIVYGILIAVGFILAKKMGL